MSLFREIIVDNFAGGGGASMGIEMATGRHVDIAINHDEDAIAMHEINHPTTEHFCESVWDIDPIKAANGQPVALAWFSPDCKHFSKAKGGKPVEKSIRGLAWVAVKWAATVRPRVIMLENVEEFQTWGPIVNGKPCPQRKGKTFTSFKNALRKLGYTVEHRELKACDYGAPTSRKRFFLVARCDGQPIKWPKPRRGQPDSISVKNGKLLPWPSAAQCIDWSLPTQSIFGRKRDLAKNTLLRIGKGIQRFVIDADEPFLVSANHTSNRTKYDCFRGQSGLEPLRTITASHGFAFVRPFVSRQFGNSIGHGILKPLGTVTSGGGGKSQLVAAHIARIGQTGGNGSYVKPVTDPLTTITTKNEHLIVAAHISKFRAGSIGYSPADPMHTICAGGETKRPGTAITQAVVAAHLSPQYGGGYNQAGQAMNKPAPTVTSVDHTAMVTSHMLQLRGTLYGKMLNAPVPTLTASGTHLGIVNASLITKFYGTNFGHPISDPLQTVTSKDRFALTNIRQINPPLSEEQRYQAWWCARFMDDYGPNAGKSGSVIPQPRRRWVTAKNGGILTDIHMRMLQPRELFRAQGFPDDYIIDRDKDGNAIPKYKQVARCGNAVPPQLAEALVKANLPEMCRGGRLYDEDTTRERAA